MELLAVLPELWHCLFVGIIYPVHPRAMHAMVRQAHCVSARELREFLVGMLCLPFLVSSRAFPSRKGSGRTTSAGPRFMRVRKPVLGSDILGRCSLLGTAWAGSSNCRNDFGFLLGSEQCLARHNASPPICEADLTPEERRDAKQHRLE